MQNQTPNRDNISSIVTLENRNKFTVSGVTKAISANETCICVQVGKTNMYVLGSMLHIEKLDTDTGILKGDGWVDTIRYNKSGNILRKIFK